MCVSPGRCILAARAPDCIYLAGYLAAVFAEIEKLPRSNGLAGLEGAAFIAQSKGQGFTIIDLGMSLLPNLKDAIISALDAIDAVVLKLGVLIISVIGVYRFVSAEFLKIREKGPEDARSGRKGRVLQKRLGEEDKKPAVDTGRTYERSTLRNEPISRTKLSEALRERDKEDTGSDRRVPGLEKTLEKGNKRSETDTGRTYVRSTSRNEPIGRNGLKEALSYAYVAVWAYTYWIRTTLVGPVLRWALVLLCLDELIAPYLPSQSWSPAWSLGLTVTLYVSAITLSVNDRRSTVRLDVVLSSIRLLLEEGALDDRDGASPLNRAVMVLNALVMSMQYGRRGVQMDATLMVRSTTDGRFRILIQDSHRTFDPDLSIDGNYSVAGRVAAGSSEVVIYVPNTRFVHGVQINLLAKYPNREYFRAMKIIPGAFEWLDDANQFLVRSLVCIRVPLTMPDVNAVLCVSGQRVNTLGDFELGAIKVAAGLLAQVFKVPGALFGAGTPKQL
jgi:hypothetical protein